MKYLPGKHVSHPFWANFSAKVVEVHEEDRILQSWTGSPLVKVKVSRYLPLHCRDMEDEPLFHSHSRTTGLCYLSPKYLFADLKLLKCLGIKSLSNAEFCRIVSLDLERFDSKTKSASTSEDWQTRTADKLLRIAESDPSQVQPLKCIPL